VIEAVLWDVGGVLLDFAPVAAGRLSWQQRLGLADGELDPLLWEAIGSHGVDETGAIVTRLSARFGLEAADAERMLWDCNDHWHPNVALVAYARSLRARGVPAAIVGNAGAAARWAFEAIVDVRSFADVVIVSAEVGCEKPDPRIYELATTGLGVAPPSCVFVDDVPAYVDAARALGITAFRHESTEATIAAIDAALAGALSARA
jgi:putative hydrolase of the HAD superfamily